MFRPLSAKMFRLSSGTRLSIVYVCERESKREMSFGVGLVLSGCFVHHQLPVRISSCIRYALVRLCVRGREGMEGERGIEGERRNILVWILFLNALSIVISLSRYFMYLFDTTGF